MEDRHGTGVRRADRGEHITRASLPSS